MAVLLLADVNGGQLATDSVAKALTAVAGLGEVHLLVAGPASAAAEAAGQGKGVVAGFGALHLPGENGVLRLLERDGWTIRPIRVEGIGNGG